jgi:polyhydroxybutyrate depolymerase
VKKLVMLLGLATVVACGGSGGADDDGDDDGVDPPRVYGGDRPVELQLPTTYDETQDYPLVILLHGFSANGIIQSAYLGLADIPTDPGAFYMTPDGTLDDGGQRFWNASDACCSGNASNPPDDVAYIGGLIDDVSADWPIDPAKVFLIGHSNGAFMAYRMACDRPDVVTAIAGLAGGASDCAADGMAVSVLHIHGDQDETVPYAGGTLGAPFPGAVESVAMWSERDGCSAELTAGDPLDLVTDLDGAETTTQAATCGDGLGVELWTIVGGSHIPNVQPSFATDVTGWLLSHARD